METIGVRELRQNASRYLHRVAAGESITVTEHGRPVAVLNSARHDSAVARMLANGEIQPPERPSGVLYGHLPEPLDLGFSASEELQHQRADRL